MAIVQLRHDTLGRAYYRRKLAAVVDLSLPVTAKTFTHHHLQLGDVGDQGAVVDLPGHRISWRART